MNFYLLLLITLLFSISAVLSESTFSINVPIYFDLPHHLSKFLIPRTQALVDAHLSTLTFPDDLSYSISISDVFQPESLVFKLGFSNNESFFVSPYGRTTTIFQTDALIAHNKMPEFISDIITGPLLGSEIANVANGYPADSVHLNLDYETTYKVNMTVLSDRFYEWDDQLFQDLFQPVLNELERFVRLEVDVVFDLIQQGMPDDLESAGFAEYLNHRGLNFYIFLLHDNLLIDNKFQNIVYPQKGGIISYTINGDMVQTDQIEIMEILTGQIFRLLGIDDFKDPLSPFIRIDMMLRRKQYYSFKKSKDI